jgi:DNA-3-methyladenine glycosylase II
LPLDQLRSCGFSASKTATVQAIAAGALSGLVPRRQGADTMDDEALITRLVQIRGIGRWTVEMRLMYSLERPDVLPASITSPATRFSWTTPAIGASNYTYAEAT